MGHGHPFTMVMRQEVLAFELEREPFSPLRLRLTHGRTIDIRNPGLAFIAKLSLYVFCVDRPHTALAEDSHVISLRHIVSVEKLTLSGQHN